MNKTAIIGREQHVFKEPEECDPDIRPVLENFSTNQQVDTSAP